MAGVESNTYLATTIYAKYETRSERIRVDLALATINQAREHGYGIVVVDGGSPEKFIYEMLDLNALVYHQENPGMGNARRQALRQAQDKTSLNGAVVWLEPEKCNLVSHIDPAADKVVNENYDLVMFRRDSLDSYPPEQAYMYKMGALAFRYLTGIDCDFLFGPVALSNRSVDYFLAYKSDYGDVWDSIHIPKLHIIRAGLPWTQVDINYRHPPEQTEVEAGDMNLFRKRIEQMSVISEALIGEMEKNILPAAHKKNSPEGSCLLNNTINKTGDPY